MITKIQAVLLAALCLLHSYWFKQSLFIIAEVENLLSTFILVVREEFVLLLFLLQLPGEIGQFVLNVLQSVLDLGEMLLQMRRLLKKRAPSYPWPGPPLKH